MHRFGIYTGTLYLRSEGGMGLYTGIIRLSLLWLWGWAPRQIANPHVYSRTSSAIDFSVFFKMSICGYTPCQQIMQASKLQISSKAVNKLSLWGAAGYLIGCHLHLQLTESNCNRSEHAAGVSYICFHRQDRAWNSVMYLH